MNWIVNIWHQQTEQLRKNLNVFVNIYVCTCLKHTYLWGCFFICIFFYYRKPCGLAIVLMKIKYLSYLYCLFLLVNSYTNSFKTALRETENKNIVSWVNTKTSSVTKLQKCTCVNGHQMILHSQMICLWWSVLWGANLAAWLSLSFEWDVNNRGLEHSSCSVHCCFNTAVYHSKLRKVV